MSILPNEVLSLIFSHLDPLELFTIQQLSSYWKKSIWRLQTQLSFDFTRNTFNSKLIESVLAKVSCSQGPPQLRSFFCNLNGFMTINLSPLTSLTTLYELDVNNLTNDEFWNFLPSFSRLTHFSSNYLIGDPILTRCTHWTRLRRLHVFTESPYFLQQLNQLEDLDIQFRNETPSIFQNFLRILQTITSLQRLNYRTSFHIGQIVPYLSYLPFLTEFRSCYCCDHYAIHHQSTFGKLVPLTSLEVLILSKCFLTKTDCSTFLELFPRLRRLHILHSETLDQSGANFTPSFSSLTLLTFLEVKIDESQSLLWLTSLKQLRHLEIFSEAEETKTPPHWEVLQCLTNLTFLYVDTYIDTPDLRPLSSLTKLQFIRCLCQSGCSSESLLSLTALTQLQHYRILPVATVDDNTFSHALRHCSQLTSLRAKNVKHIGTETLHEIQKLTLLQEIFLFSSTVTKQTLFFDTLASLVYLTHLELDHVEGLNSATLHKLTKLKTLNSISFENMAKIDNHCIKCIATLTRLKQLELINCTPFNEKSFKYLTSLQFLNTIRICHNDENVLWKVRPLCRSLCHLSRLCHITISVPTKCHANDFMSLTKLPFLQRLCLVKCPENCLEQIVDSLKLTHVNIYSVDCLQTN